MSERIGNPPAGPAPAPSSERRRVIREGMWVGSGQAATALAKLAGLRLITGLLTPSAFGEVSLLLGVAALGNNVFLTPVHQATLRFYPEAAKSARVAALRRVIVTLLARSTLVLLALLAAGALVWKTYFGGETSAVAILLVGALLAMDVPRGFEAAMLNAARRQRAFASWNGLDAWARPLFAVAAILLLGPFSSSVLLGNLVGCALVYLLFRTLLIGRRDEAPRDHDGWTAATRREIVRYSAPLVPLAALSWVISVSDRYVVAALAGTEAAGLYAAVYGLGSQPFIAMSSIGVMTFRPILFDAVARGDVSKERKTILAWLAIFVAGGALGVVLVHLLSRWVVGIALGPAFRGVSSYLTWIAAAYALQGVQNVFETMIYAQRRTRRLVVLQAAGAVFSVSCYSILIPALGARGAAIAVCLSLALSCGLSVLLAGVPARLGFGRSRPDGGSSSASP